MDPSRHNVLSGAWKGRGRPIATGMMLATPVLSATPVLLAAIVCTAATHAATWTPAPAFPDATTARAYAAGLNFGGTLLTIGGTPLGTSGDKDTPVHYLSPGASTWSVGPWAEGRIVRPGAGIDSLGRIIVFGSVDGIDPEGDAGAAYLYDLVEGQFQSIAARGAAAAPDYFAWATDDVGRVYSFGGGPGPGASATEPNSAYAERYLASGDAWETITPLPVAVGDAAAVYDGRGHILVLGGYDAHATTRLAVVQQFDLATETWSTTAVAPLPAPLSGLRAVLGADDRVYALGGETGAIGAGVTQTATYALDPATDSWHPVANMATPRRHFAVALGDDDHIYAMGGENDTGGTHLVEKLYTPPCPVFVGSPTSIERWEGPTVALHAVVEGGTPLSYRWQHDGADLFDGPSAGGGQIIGADTVTLTITQIAPADAGDYALVATNPCGVTASTPATLTVRAAPAIPVLADTRRLHPGWAKTSRATGVAGDTQAGVCTRDVPEYNDIDRPTVWHGSAASAVDLTPAGSVGGAVSSAGGAYQVGWWWWPYQCQIGGQWYTCYQSHAAAWSGTPASHDDIHVSGWEYTSASDTDGTYHVGTVSRDDAVGNYTTHAVLYSPPNYWSRDLHPAGVSKSGALAIDGGNQYGWIHTPFPGPVTHAAMWSGTAESFEDMQPSGAQRSEILGAGDAQQVGIAEFGGAWHAGLWADSPGSFIDLHPVGASTSHANDCAGGLQVGYVTDTGGRHAAIWAGSVDSWTDLHGYLPADFTSSNAAAIDIATNGVVTIVGDGYNATTGRTEAVMWRSGFAPGDCDADGDLDLDDHALFVGCLGGPGLPVEPDCSCSDLNADGFADLADFAAWQAALAP